VKESGKVEFWKGVEGGEGWRLAFLLYFTSIKNSRGLKGHPFNM